MITAAVCDDEESILTYMSEKIRSEFGALNVEADLFSASDPFLLLEKVKTEPPEVLFLDIDMPKLGGMEIARYITENDIRTLLVFVTSHDALVYKSLCRFLARAFSFPPIYGALFASFGRILSARAIILRISRL